MSEDDSEYDSTLSESGKRSSIEQGGADEKSAGSSVTAAYIWGPRQALKEAQKEQSSLCVADG